MKKIIATILRILMPNMIRQHEREERNRRVHNANVLQHLLDAEHIIRDKVNEDYNQVFTTKNAIKCANKTGFTVYSSRRALMEADFR